MKLIQLLALQHIEPIKDPSKNYKVDSANQTFTEYKAATLTMIKSVYCNKFSRLESNLNIAHLLQCTEV